MNAVVKTDGHAVIDLADWRSNQAEAIQTLKDSLYPGAKDESVIMVLRYCEAAKLDPLLKPVHLVPMSVKTGRKNVDGYDIYETRDQVMPGIGLYRTNAARTGEYAGLTEPEFGPLCVIKFQRRDAEWYTKENGQRAKREKWVDAEIEYPLWCKIVAQRIVQGHVRDFVAVEYWTENYATAGKDSVAPNSMWARRPRGQLAKCAEAQALRKAFPESAGSQPTAEEMEGRYLDLDEAPALAAPNEQLLMPKSVSETQQGAPIGAAAESAAPAAEPPAQSASAETAAPVATTQTAGPATPPPGETKPAGKPISEGMLRVLKKKASVNKIDEAKICSQFAVARLEDLTGEAINKAMAFAGQPA